MSAYLPPAVYSTLAELAASAVGDDDGDGSSLLLSALEATTPPAWLTAALPSEYAAPVHALVAAVASLRPVTDGAVVSTAAFPDTGGPQLSGASRSGSVTLSPPPPPPPPSPPASSPGNAVTATATTTTAAAPGHSTTTATTGKGTSTATGSSSSSSSSGNAAAVATAMARDVVGGLAALVGLAVVF